MTHERTISVRTWLKALADATGAFQVESVKAAERSRLAAQSAADCTATLMPAGGRKRIRLLIEAKSRMNPREALSACAQDNQSGRRGREFDAIVIACPYISPRVAQICREHGVGYLDQAGNCDIRAGGLVVHVDGRPNVTPDTRPLSSPFTPKASRVARLLLGQPGRTWQVQELAREGRISLGLAFKAKDTLIEQGYVEEREGRVALRDARALLDAWAPAYKPPARRSQLYVMDEPARAEEAVATWCECQRVEYGLAEFSGAWRLAPMVRYKQACVCVRESASHDIFADLMKALDAKPVESGSNLTVLVSFDESVFFDSREAEGIHVLSPVQLYLDLATQRGRGREAADELLRRVLEPSFEQVTRPANEKAHTQ